VVGVLGKASTELSTVTMNSFHMTKPKILLNVETFKTSLEGIQRMNSPSDSKLPICNKIPNA